MNKKSSGRGIFTLDILVFLGKINDLKIGGRNIAEQFSYQGYDFWQLYQQLITEDIKTFKDNVLAKSGKVRLIIAIKSFVANFSLALLSIIGFLSIVFLRKKVLVYSIDKVSGKRHRADPRMQTVYDFLHGKDIKYAEIIHTVLGIGTFINFFKRRRAVIYLESVDFVFNIAIFFRFIKRSEINIVREFDLSSFEGDEEKDFVKWLVAKYIKAFMLSKFRIVFFKKLFKISAIKMFLSIDDVRYYNEIILACRLRGIPSYAFQHGHFTKYHVGWLLKSNAVGLKTIAPDKIIVWGEYWKKELVKLGTYFKEDQILVGGTEYAVPPKEIFDKTDSESIVILIPYEKSIATEDVLQHINNFLNCPDVFVIFKLRADISKEKQLKEYGLTEKLHKHFSTTFNARDVLDKTDIVAGTYSTFLYDMIAYNKPVVILKTASDYGEGMAQNRLAEIISPDEKDIYSKLLAIKNTSRAELESRKTKLFGENPASLNKTITEIVSQYDLI